jgi:hypothetical protein
MLRSKKSFPFVFDIKSASFYHRNRVNARLVTLWSRDTLIKVILKETVINKKSCWLPVIFTKFLLVIHIN